MTRTELNNVGTDAKRSDTSKTQFT